MVKQLFEFIEQIKILFKEKIKLMQNQMDSPLLEIKDLQAGFVIKGKYHNAVNGVNFKIRRKEVVCIVGESGCGKSVMSLSVMKLLPKMNAKIASGEVIFQGKDLATKSVNEMNKIRGKELSMIFQEPMTALNPVFTIGSHLAEAISNHETDSKQNIKKRSIDLLRLVNIPRPEKIINEYPHQLSGGMRQRVMIAIAIALNPNLLIADEPTTALDVTVQAQILDLLKDIQEKVGMAIMLITHDLGVVAEMADRVVVMYAGEVVEEAEVVDLFYHPKHPYTESLLNSVPKMDEDLEQLNTIKGIVPPIDKMPEVGCRFVDRCPKSFEDCHSITPQLKEVRANHTAQCLLYEECYPTKVSGAKEGVKQ